MDNLIHKEEVFNIIGAAMEVHRELGPGFLEAVYQEALEIELEKRSIPYLAQEHLLISYKGIELKKEYIADFVCFNNIIVEIKALSALTTEHQAQILNYLKASGSKLGLLINFGTSSLEYKRLVH